MKLWLGMVRAEALPSRPCPTQAEPSNLSVAMILGSARMIAAVCLNYFRKQPAKRCSCCSRSSSPKQHTVVW